MKIILRLITVFILILIILIIKQVYRLYFAADSKARVMYDLPQLADPLELATLMELYKGRSFIQIDDGKNEWKMKEFISSVFTRWPTIETYYLISQRDTHMKNKKLKVSRVNPIVIYKKFSDLSIDFIYLNHSVSYCDVYKLLNLYWPKLSIGCIIAGKLNCLFSLHISIYMYCVVLCYTSKHRNNLEKLNTKKSSNFFLNQRLKLHKSQAYNKHRFQAMS
jgi:hypothetical protein